MFNFDTYDIQLITQPLIEFKIKVEVYDSITDTYIDAIEGALIGGSSNIDCSSDVRRTATLQIVPTYNQRIVFETGSLLWLNRYVKLYIGIKDQREGTYRWYPQGVYSYQNISMTYDETNNQIDISLSDKWTDLDGTKSGEVWTTVEIPAYLEDESTGEVIEYYYIRNELIAILDLLGIKEYEVSEIGEYKGMAEMNPTGYLEYREESKVETLSGLQETWNALPSDQTFDIGSSMADILTTFRDLYPNYEMFFDEDGTFITQMIPSRNDDDIVMEDKYFQQIIVSENTSVDLTTVRNMQMVFGESFETDYYTEDVTLTGSCYVATCEGYEEKYYNSDKIGLMIPSTNVAGATINVNSFGELPIYDEDSDAAIDAGYLEANTVYVFKIKTKYINKTTVYRAYVLGHYQAQGMYVLTDGTVSTNTYTTQDGDVVQKYSKEYFQAKYNCQKVEFETIADSPYTIQVLGEKLGVKSGSDYDAITSDSLALSRAQYELYKSARLTDNITIVTKLCPFADVNIKVSYRRSDHNYTDEYIVKSIAHDWSNGQTTWTLMKFYSLYQNM